MIEEFDQDGDGESAFVWLNSPCEWASNGRVMGECASGWASEMELLG